MASATETLLELSSAAKAAGQHLPRRPRARLEIAIAAALALSSRQPVPAAKPGKDAALDALRSALKLCVAARVEWPEVVGIVNKETEF